MFSSCIKEKVRKKQIETLDLQETDSIQQTACYCRYQPYSGWAFLGLLTDGTFWPPLPKIRHTYPTMMKLDTVYLT